MNSMISQKVYAGFLKVMETLDAKGPVEAQVC